MPRTETLATPPAQAAPPKSPRKTVDPNKTAQALAAPPAQATPPKSPRKTVDPNKGAQATAETGTATKVQASTGTSNVAKSQVVHRPKGQATNTTKVQADKTVKVQAGNTTKAQTGSAPKVQTNKTEAPVAVWIQDRADAQAGIAVNEGAGSGFFYGTLMFPEVFYTVCYGKARPSESIRKLHTFKPARLNGYQRLCVQDADYPGITRTKNRCVYGTFVTGLTKANIERLDIFEGQGYDRWYVTVDLVKRIGNGDLLDEGKARTQTYVFKYPDELENAPWDPEDFHRNAMADYI